MKYKGFQLAENLISVLGKTKHPGKQEAADVWVPPNNVVPALDAQLRANCSVIPR
jgi:hypothetical protein